MKKIIFILPVIAITGFFLYKGIINLGKPEIKLEKEPKAVGTDYRLSFYIEDERPGLNNVSVKILQNGKEITLLEENFKEPVKSKKYIISINAQKLGLAQNKAEIIITAKDNSILHNKKEYRKEVIIDTEPPVLSILYSSENIINGGTGFVFYKVSNDTIRSGLTLENYNFRCFSGLFKDKDIYTCAFPYPYYFNDKKPIYVYAEDEAGNKATQAVNYTFKFVKYANSVIEIDDNFINNKIKQLSDKNIQNPIELFKYVNVEIRRKNEEKIHKISSECKNIYPMFEGAFEQLKNSAKLGGFADYRKYKYNGQIIEGADAYHKGFDFASVKNAPVYASNKGFVVFTGNLGIYGNSVIIDHGLCIYSIYSHLSEISVKNGDKVDKNSLIGKTGTTGLAVGDHLHFGILVQGLEVNPIEWFDYHWIKTRFLEPIEKINKGG